MDTFQVLVATQLAIMSHQSQTLKTHSVFSEIVYNISPTKKVTTKGLWYTLYMPDYLLNIRIDFRFFKTLWNEWEWYMLSLCCA